MTTVYFVNCGAEEEGPAEDGAAYEVVSVAGAPALLREMFRARLGSERDYEGEISIVVYDDREQELSVEQLQELVQSFMPCLNIAVTGTEGWRATVRAALEAAAGSGGATGSRYWMYAEGAGEHSRCSVKMYSMAKHLSSLGDTQEEKSNEYREYLMRHVNPSDLVAVPHDDSHYWSLLDTWSFNAHALGIVELIWCAKLVISKLCAAAATACPEPAGIILLLLHLECSYHQRNKFHNFRHAVDVMQATYQLCDLLKLDPSISLTLCISAIGHDVAHPGTNNALMCKYGSPVAKHYDGVSVLENFHNDIFISILGQHWPEFSGVMQRQAIRDAIISTDMALHEQYLSKLRACGTRSLREDIPLLTSLIIKAADISNVSRPLIISAQWAVLISYEFDHCTFLENRLKDKSSSEGESTMEELDKVPDSIDEIVSKFPGIPGGQLFFITTFVEGLFAGLAEKFRELKFLSDNVQSNKNFWLQLV
ncbi:AaceriADR395Cp [[Ashbya] aceris (nom. inval.)]|nr:AaceriADR395Cp [[Ashbya] aceris (nom. inval.)]